MVIHILRLADDEPYRREGHGQKNLVEGRHDLARRIFHGKKGEITAPTNAWKTSSRHSGWC